MTRHPYGIQSFRVPQGESDKHGRSTQEGEHQRRGPPRGRLADHRLARARRAAPRVGGHAAARAGGRGRAWLPATPRRPEPQGERHRGARALRGQRHELDLLRRPRVLLPHHPGRDRGSAPERVRSGRHPRLPQRRVLGPAPVRRRRHLRPSRGRRRHPLPARPGPSLRDHRSRPGPPGRGVLGGRRRRPGDATGARPPARARRPRCRRHHLAHHRPLDADGPRHVPRLVPPARSGATRGRRGGRHGGGPRGRREAAARGPAPPRRRVRHLRAAGDRPAPPGGRSWGSTCPASSWSPARATSAWPRRAPRR